MYSSGYLGEQGNPGHCGDNGINGPKGEKGNLGNCGPDGPTGSTQPLLFSAKKDSSELSAKDKCPAKTVVTTERLKYNYIFICKFFCAKIGFIFDHLQYKPCHFMGGQFSMSLFFFIRAIWMSGGSRRYWTRWTEYVRGARHNWQSRTPWVKRMYWRLINRRARASGSNWVYWLFRS